jgi:signal transduction histidine kinase
MEQAHVMTPDQMTTPANSDLKYQQQIASLERQLIDAQRRSALGELLSTTTHEFNNVLMSVINYAKMGLRHKDDATREKCLQKILTAGDRAATISRSILGIRAGVRIGRLRRVNGQRLERKPRLVAAAVVTSGRLLHHARSLS